MLPGLEIFYRSIADTLKSKNESIVSLVHYTFISKGFKCIGLGEKFNENDQDSKGSELLPTDWNANDFFILKYIHPIKKRVLVKIVPSDTILLVHALLKDKDDQIFATHLDPKNLITDDYKKFDKLFQKDDSLNNLVNELNKEIFDKFEPKKILQKTKNEERKETNLIINPPCSSERPSRMPNLPFNNPQTPTFRFPQVGGADLDPLGRGIGGGMFMDPRNLEDFHNPLQIGPSRNPLRFDPSSGLEQPLPPGAVPPGARFEYIGPVRPNPRGSSSRQRPPNPDLEPFPSGYEDMFM